MRLLGTALPRVLAVAALLGAAGCASVAEPGDEADFARSGAYVGLYGLQSFENFSVSGTDVDTGNSDLGVGGRLGYRFTSALAAEVVAENVRGFEVSEGTIDADLSLTNVGVMGKYYLASDRFQPYVVAGAGMASSDINKDFDYDTDGGFLRGGIGLDIYLFRTLALFGEANYNHLMGGVSDLHHIDFQVGVLFRF